jgi:Kef-type K+ transport system membrane component KefB
MTGLTFLVVFLVLFSLLSILPIALKRIHVPSVVAIMLVGIVIGPNGIDLIRHLNHFLGRGYPTEQIYVVLDAMGLLGMVFLMTLAGMEVNLRTFFRERRTVLLLSLFTFAIPAMTGFAVFSVFEPGNMIGAWVLASLFASHSVGVVFHVVREQKVIGTRLGLGVLGATVITDICSLILLATCIQFQRPSGGYVRSLSLFDHIEATMLGPWFPVVFIATVGVFIAGSLWLAPPVLNAVFSRLGIRGDGHLTYLLAGILFIAFLGELLGISIIVSSFIAGMALVRTPAFQQDARKLRRDIEGIGFGFVVPFLFLTIGMQTDLRVLFEARENLALVVLVVSGLVASKDLGLVYSRIRPDCLRYPPLGSRRYWGPHPSGPISAELNQVHQVRPFTLPLEHGFTFA